MKVMKDTHPTSLVTTSAIRDHAHGDPIHIWVKNAGTAINHLPLNFSDATFESNPNIPPFDVGVGVVDDDGDDDDDDDEKCLIYLELLYLSYLSFKLLNDNDCE